MVKQEMTCEHCRKAVPISEVKYMPKGKEGMTALCPDCRNKYVPTKAGAKEEPKSDKVPYFCIRCKYKFKYNPKAGTALRCPFCGKEDKIIVDKAPDADTLIRTLHDE